MSVFSAKDFWLPVLLTTFVAAFFGAVLGRRGRQLDVMLAGEARLAGRLSDLKDENERARAERDALLSSPEAIEKAAREEFGLAAPGETVVPYVSSLPPPRRASAQARRSRLETLLTWRGLPLALPAVVFVVSALVFGIWNAGVRARRVRAA